jgi:hypothetical protein
MPATPRWKSSCPSDVPVWGDQTQTQSLTPSLTPSPSRSEKKDWEGVSYTFAPSSSHVELWGVTMEGCDEDQVIDEVKSQKREA